MSSELHRDNNGQPVQTFVPVSPVSVTISASSQALAIPTNSKFLRVAATGNVWMEFGLSGVTASTSSILFPQGVETFPVPEGATHVACIQAGAATGIFSINRMR